MTVKEEKLKQARLPESAQVFDESEHEFVVAYRKDFKRVKTITLIDAVTFNAVTTTKTGNLFEVPAFAKALILIDLDVTGAPTDILFEIFFSEDRQNWYKYMIGPFGDLRYEDAAGDKYECLEIPILAPYMRCKVTATGTDASKTFLTTVKAILNG